MPEAKRLIGEVVAEPQHLAIMGLALESAWDKAAVRFSGAPPEIVAAARNDLANGIINAFKMGATDLLPLKHSGLTALMTKYPERFSSAASN